MWDVTFIHMSNSTIYAYIPCPVNAYVGGCINAYVIYYINAYLHACIKCNIDAYISCYIHTNIRCYVHACTISQNNAYILDAILKQNAASIHILHTIFILYRMLHLCMHYVILMHVVDGIFINLFDIIFIHAIILQNIDHIYIYVCIRMHMHIHIHIYKYIYAAYIYIYICMP